MESSERVSWEDCPICSRPAAVGWVAGQPVEFDCPRGCRPTLEQIEALRPVSIRPMVDRLARPRPMRRSARTRECRYRTSGAYAVRWAD